MSYKDPEKKKAYDKAYYKKNKEEYLAKRGIYNKSYFKAHREEIYNKHKAERDKVRLEILAAYGGKCTCCGETDQRFLVIDHINGGGNKQRHSLNLRGAGYYSWMKRNNYPQDLQVLCHNCNCAKAFYGECPHETERKNHDQSESELFTQASKETRHNP
jgi:hypothetical protein